MTIEAMHPKYRPFKATRKTQLHKPPSALEHLVGLLAIELFKIPDARHRRMSLWAHTQRVTEAMDALDAEVRRGGKK
jgi:hypothetical protein